MNKDIVYIDVEDDVTGIIGKVRASSEKIVALVPPKNIGTLQSAVNLRLLQKAADNAGKRIVLITGNSGLTALAAGVKMPVAKNLQSKPEIPDAGSVAVGEEDEVIKGEELPVGELAAAAEGAAAVPDAAAPGNTLASGTAPTQPPAVPSTSSDDLIIDDASLPDLSADVPVAAAAPKKKSTRVPDFNRFRKWIFIGIGLVVAVIAFFVLTNIFWTGASVVITARTSDQPIDAPLTLSGDAATNPDSGIIHAETKTLKKTASVDFTPTGQKNVGDKATGTVKFSTNNISNLGTTIPAGTQLTSSGGSVYLTNQAVTISFSNYNDAETGITAQSQGASSNGASGSVSGAPSGINASLVGSTSGGTDKTVTVVSADDVTQATAKLAASDSDAAKSALTGQFGNDYVVVTDSFTAQDASPVSNPAAGSQATSAKLTRDSTYTLVAIKKDQIKLVTTDALNGQLGANQKIYDDGSAGAHLSQFITSPSGVQTLHLSTTGKIGPNIDENALKTQLVGKKTEEIIQLIKATNGVRDVSVHFSPFWRTTAPGADKIKVSFDLSGNGS